MEKPKQFREISPLTLSNSRRLRRAMTDPERKLWRYLRQRQLDGCHFRRQHPVGNYIADFACTERKLIIELDGSQHASVKNQIHDRKRDVYLNQQGYRVLRIWNNEVVQNIEGVLETIFALLQEPAGIILTADS